MKTTKSPCKITGVVVTKVEIREAVFLGAECSFVGENLVRYGSAQLNNFQWPAEVREAAKELQDRIEQHLMSMYFEDGGMNDTAGTAGTSSQRELTFPPSGLGQVGLVSPEDEPGQV